VEVWTTCVEGREVGTGDEGEYVTGRVKQEQTRGLTPASPRRTGQLRPSRSLVLPALLGLLERLLASPDVRSSDDRS
jgi:hypothetical protein